MLTMMQNNSNLNLNINEHGSINEQANSKLSDEDFLKDFDALVNTALVRHNLINKPSTTSIIDNNNKSQNSSINLIQNYYCCCRSKPNSSNHSHSPLSSVNSNASYSGSSSSGISDDSVGSSAYNLKNFNSKLNFNHEFNETFKVSNNRLMSRNKHMPKSPLVNSNSVPQKQKTPVSTKTRETQNLSTINYKTGSKLVPKQPSENRPQVRKILNLENKNVNYQSAKTNKSVLKDKINVSYSTKNEASEKSKMIKKTIKVEPPRPRQNPDDTDLDVSELCEMTNKSDSGSLGSFSLGSTASTGTQATTSPSIYSTYSSLKTTTDSSSSNKIKKTPTKKLSLNLKKSSLTIASLSSQLSLINGSKLFKNSNFSNLIIELLVLVLMKSNKISNSNNKRILNNILFSNNKSFLNSYIRLVESKSLESILMTKFTGNNINISKPKKTIISKKYNKSMHTVPRSSTSSSISDISALSSSFNNDTDLDLELELNSNSRQKLIYEDEINLNSTSTKITDSKPQCHRHRSVTKQFQNSKQSHLEIPNIDDPLLFIDTLYNQLLASGGNSKKEDEDTRPMILISSPTSSCSSNSCTQSCCYNLDLKRKNLLLQTTISSSSIQSNSEKSNTFQNNDFSFIDLYSNRTNEMTSLSTASTIKDGLLNIKKI